MNCITIELCAEDRARIDRLVAAAEALLGSRVAPEVVKPEPVVPPVEVTEAPVVPAAEPVPVPSLSEFQAKLAQRCSESADMRAKVRDLLNQYAPSASAVPEDKRSEVLAKLAGI